MTAHETSLPTEFRFEGLSIEKIVAHRIFARKADKQSVAPKCSSKLVALDGQALDALQKRITEALGSRSHGVEMSIEKSSAESFFQNSAKMLHATDEDFIALSKIAAQSLTAAQNTPVIPGGVLTIISGRIGNDQLRFLAAIKAETQDGFRTEENAESVTMQYLKDLLLTPTQRLYKIGLIVEIATHKPTEDGYEPSNFRAFLFDHLMTALETRKAAAYFYEAFLGMGIQSSAKKLTRDFFEFTKTFINTSQIEEDKKIELTEALRVELRSNAATVSARDFADRHLDGDLSKSYIEHMKNNGFPQNAVVKDNDYIKARLRKPRKLLFTSGVLLSGPADGFQELVKIMPTNDEGETLVRISGSIRSRE